MHTFKKIDCDCRDRCAKIIQIIRGKEKFDFSSCLILGAGLSGVGPIEGAKSNLDLANFGRFSQKWSRNSFCVVEPFKPLVAGDFPSFWGLSEVFRVSNGRPLADHFYL